MFHLDLKFPRNFRFADPIPFFLFFSLLLQQMNSAKSREGLISYIPPSPPIPSQHLAFFYIVIPDTFCHIRIYPPPLFFKGGFPFQNRSLGRKGGRGVARIERR